MEKKGNKPSDFVNCFRSYLNYNFSIVNSTFSSAYERSINYNLISRGAVQRNSTYEKSGPCDWY